MVLSTRNCHRHYSGLPITVLDLAGLVDAEIGGGWLVWQTIRNKRPWYFLVAGWSLMADGSSNCRVLPKDCWWYGWASVSARSGQYLLEQYLFASFTVLTLNNCEYPASELKKWSMERCHHLQKPIVTALQHTKSWCTACASIYRVCSVVRLRSDSHPAAPRGHLQQGVCRVWWGVHCDELRLGLGGRPRPAGPRGHCGGLPGTGGGVPLLVLAEKSRPSSRSWQQLMS